MGYDPKDEKKSSNEDTTNSTNDKTVDSNTNVSVNSDGIGNIVAGRDVTVTTVIAGEKYKQKVLVDLNGAINLQKDLINEHDTLQSQYKSLDTISHVFLPAIVFFGFLFLLSQDYLNFLPVSVHVVLMVSFGAWLVWRFQFRNAELNHRRNDLNERRQKLKSLDDEIKRYKATLRQFTDTSHG